MRNIYGFLLASILFLLAGNVSAQTITVTSPNGGENWNGCVARNITWSMTGIASPYFDIDYSPDNGSNWVAVASNYFSPGGTYSWTLPNITSSSFLVRVKLSSNGTIQDVSNALFSVTGPLILTAPNGGQSWVSGTTQTITWNPNGTSNNYNIEYSTNNGASWVTIVNPLSTTGNTYNWVVPNTPSNTCRVRVSDNGDPSCKVDVSDNVFYILSSITVTQPNGGQTWTATVGNQGVTVNMDNVTVTANTGNFYDNGGAGANYTVGATLTKTFLPDVGTNKLRFYFNSFTSYNTNDYLRIYNGPTTASPLIGQYSGTTLPPTVTSSHATGALTFQWVTNSGYTSAGWDANFVSVGTPTQNINWSIVGTSGKFNLDYSTNGGTTWIRIVSGWPSSTGVFPWNVPNTPSTNSLVKVSDAGNGTIVDQSDAVFTIGPANPLLLAPNGGETWYAGTVQNITWVPAFFTGANVKLEYSTDNGSTWTTVVSSTPNASGSFAWTLPNTPSATSLVRVSDASNSSINDVSNAVFTIAPHVTVASPNGGQNWTGCSTQNITINHGGTSGLLNIQYSTDNGTSWVNVATNYNAGAGPVTNYSWQVPNISTTQALVRVTDAGDALKTDVSNAVFTITQTTNIVLLTPNGNENWVSGTTQAITYS
ncbi:MAG TPA: CUB domain-containing protein, partial [Bacteroidia bacterium]|nr:CUB domain-containing protein [Bacteroidia bacterium]